MCAQRVSHPVRELYLPVIDALRHHNSSMALERLIAEHGRLAQVHQVVADYLRNEQGSLLERLNISPKSPPRLLESLKLTLKYHLDHNLELVSSLPHLAQSFQELRAIMEQHISDSSPIHKDLIMCSECEQRSALTKCDQCEDDFCHSCFEKIHSTGNRIFHSSIEIPQLVCVGCDNRFAALYCIDCGLFFCETCFPSIHAKRPELVKHRKRNFTAQRCNECEESQATLFCQNCIDLFCPKCFMDIHRRGNRKSHSTLTIDSTGYMYRNRIVLEKSESDALLERVRFPSFTL